MLKEVCVLVVVLRHAHVDDDQSQSIFRFLEHYIFEFEVAVHETA